MRDLHQLDQYRLTQPAIIEYFGGIGDHTCGAFAIPSPLDSFLMRVIASSDRGWDHVSVSRATRCPTWNEMEYVKRLFFKPDETAMQLHVPTKDHINVHPYCLHIWRPQSIAIPLPPSDMVG